MVSPSNIFARSNCSTHSAFVFPVQRKIYFSSPKHSKTTNSIREGSGSYAWDSIKYLFPLYSISFSGPPIKSKSLMNSAKVFPFINYYPLKKWFSTIHQENRISISDSISLMLLSPNMFDFKKASIFFLTSVLEILNISL